MMFIHKRGKFPCWIKEDITQSLVNCSTSVAHFIENCLKDYDIREDTFLEHIDLIQNNIHIQQQVVRAFRFLISLLLPRGER
jgi:hypothetical protein